MLSVGETPLIGGAELVDSGVLGFGFSLFHTW